MSSLRACIKFEAGAEGRELPPDDFWSRSSSPLSCELYSIERASFCVGASRCKARSQARRGQAPFRRGSSRGKADLDATIRPSKRSGGAAGALMNRIIRKSSREVDLVYTSLSGECRPRLIHLTRRSSHCRNCSPIAVAAHCVLPRYRPLRAIEFSDSLVSCVSERKSHTELAAKNDSDELGPNLDTPRPP